jgi:hypothetical protein
VWRLYLQRAIAAGDDSQFESALAYSKHPVSACVLLCYLPSFWCSRS